MARILYCILSEGGARGGHKMAVRHVETLRGLGFDASVYVPRRLRAPAWFEHTAPVLHGGPIRGDDIAVFPEDASDMIRQLIDRPPRIVIFCQGAFFGAPFDVFDAFAPDDLPPFIAVGQDQAANMRRAFPGAQIEVVPCFADERVFKPGTERRAAIAFAPRKRSTEAPIIEALFKRLHPAQRNLAWERLQGASEAEVASVLGRSGLFLSLSRFESVGLTPLEAMASGCLVAGFTGIGGREYATEDNGFWVPDDDCLAAADALAQAADVVLTGGPMLQARLEAGYETARTWSYAAFRPRLEAFWERLAPQARTMRAGA